MLSSAQLARCLFPVGEMEKPETRRIAGELGLRTATKPDSQEICFVRNGDVGGYMREHVPEASIPGEILDASGTVIGAHKGIGNYTIGQRRGLGVSLGMPVFVNAIDAAARTITIGDRSELETGAFIVEEVSWTTAPPLDGARVFVQHRAHGETFAGNLAREPAGRWSVTLEAPVEAVAPGQSAAFYSGDAPEELIGGGVISETTRAGALA
jgi:tRNA-specific 2-thiouridylase